MNLLKRGRREIRRSKAHLGESIESDSIQNIPDVNTVLRLSATEDDLRLDLALSQKFNRYSRSRFQRFIRDGRVLVDGERVLQPSYRLKAGQIIEVRLPTERIVEIIPQKIPLDVLYEDDQVLIINKSAGMVVHPSAGHQSGTVVNAALAHDPGMEGIAGEVRPGIVHRLDKDTSGVLVLAKTESALLELQKQFKDRTVEKEYLALVEGAPPSPEGRIEAPIGRDPQRRDRMAVVPLNRGREAITLYSTIETFPQHHLLNVQPRTGRTHQIRVHLAFIDCPVAGDRLYGRKKVSLHLSRQFLHAATLKLLLPGEKQQRIINAPLPSELAGVLAGLRSRN